MVEDLKNKRAIFWTLNTSGWLLYWLFSLLITHNKILQDGNLTVVTWTFCVYFFGFPIILVMSYLYRIIHQKSQSIILISTFIFFISAIFAHLWFGYSYVVASIFEINQFRGTPGSMELYLWPVFSWSLVLIAWSALYFFVKFWIDWDMQTKAMKKAVELAQSAQLKMLRYQLNPHFLFNSLNSIRALIEEDEEEAKLMLNKFSEYLGYSLNSKKYADVPLGEEIEAIRQYFAIEKKRFENKLDVELKILPLAENFPVLSFMLHPLIENALKYGMQTSSIPLKIVVKARADNNILTVEVFNSGMWVRPSEVGRKNRISIGSGLDNVRQRLDNAYPNNHQFFVFRREDGVYVRIEITGKLQEV